MKKREFLKSASAVTVLSAFGLSLESCSDDNEPTPTGDEFEFDTSVSPYSNLKIEGQWLLVREQTILLVNVAGSISAFSSVCTHANCSTNWSLGINAKCTCHNSIFDTSGLPISGPANRPLTRVSVTQEGDMVTIG